MEGAAHPLYDGEWESRERKSNKKEPRPSQVLQRHAPSDWLLPVRIHLQQLLPLVVCSKFEFTNELNRSVDHSPQVLVPTRNNFTDEQRYALKI